MRRAGEALRKFFAGGATGLPGRGGGGIGYDLPMGLGLPEMLFIFFLALMVFGPKRLPEIGRQVGKFMAEFKRYSNEFKQQVEAEVRQLELDEALKKADAINPPPVAAEALKAAAPEGTISAAPLEGGAAAEAPAPAVDAKAPDA